LVQRAELRADTIAGGPASYCRVLSPPRVYLWPHGKYMSIWRGAHDGGVIGVRYFRDFFMIVSWYDSRLVPLGMSQQAL
jgi:hypothetical protein